MNSRILITCGLALAGLVVPVLAQNPPGLKELKIGDPAPAFKLIGIDDKTLRWRTSRTASFSRWYSPRITVRSPTPPSRG